MAPPPPPPPGPPPPPMNAAPMSNSTGQERNMLLHSIRQGTKLKKTVTVDKSGPLIPGASRVGGTTNNNESSRDIVSSNSPRLNGAPPGLGGLFAGGMPKLKSTGLRIGSTTNSSTETPAAKGFTAETKNRGPPPQPPPASQKPTIPSSASDSILTSTSPANNGHPSRPMNGPPVLPNKAPVGGYGKPNVAPKPPVMREPSSPNYTPNTSSLHQQSNSISGSSQTLNDFRAGSSQNLAYNSQNDQAGKPSPPPKKISLNGVNRAQSMRVPRSPPVAPPTNPPFPPNVKHNLVKNQSGLHQSQDSLNYRNFSTSKMGTLPHNFQKTAPNIPPPPTPNQSQRGTPTKPPVTRPPPPPSRPAAPPAPPPPPPHRTSPAPPPPPLQGRLPPAAPISVPPAPPLRNSSMRNGAPSYPTDIENKFASLFHNVQEFPTPGVFRNVPKTYNTRTPSNAKQPAPPPPVHSQGATHMQLSNTKMWLSNTSQC